jgi:hypothetical protein
MATNTPMKFFPSKWWIMKPMKQQLFTLSAQKVITFIKYFLCNSDFILEIKKEKNRQFRNKDAFLRRKTTGKKEEDSIVGNSSTPPPSTPPSSITTTSSFSQNSGTLTNVMLDTLYDPTLNRKRQRNDGNCSSADSDRETEPDSASDSGGIIIGSLLYKKYPYLIQT